MKKAWGYITAFFAGVLALVFLFTRSKATSSPVEHQLEEKIDNAVPVKKEDVATEEAKKTKEEVVKHWEDYLVKDSNSDKRS